MRGRSPSYDENWGHSGIFCEPPENPLKNADFDDKIET